MMATGLQAQNIKYTGLLHRHSADGWGLDYREPANMSAGATQIPKSHDERMFETNGQSFGTYVQMPYIEMEFGIYVFLILTLML